MGCSWLSLLRLYLCFGVYMILLSKKKKGTKMYKVVQKLKRVKIALKELNKEGFSDIKTTKLQAH